MSRVLAFVDGSPSSFPVQRTARRVAQWLGADVDVVHVRADPDRPATVDPTGKRVIDGDPASILIDESQRRDVVAVVMGARSMAAKPVGHLTQRLLAEALVPLVVVPADSAGLDRASRRILVPLDGDPATTEALRPLAGILQDQGVDVHLVHFLDSGSVPPFIGAGHDLEILAEEFRILHLPDCNDGCDLRLGHPAQHLIEILHGSPTGGPGFDALLVAWHRSLQPGRAETLRRLLRESPVPLIVVPIAIRPEVD